MNSTLRAAFAATRLAYLCLGLAAAGAAVAGGHQPPPPPAPSTAVPCDGHGTGLTSQAGFLACSGSWPGNNANQQSFIDAQVMTDWGLALLAPVDVTPGAGSATPDVLTFAPETGKFVISLKTGDGFSLYEFDGSLVAGGLSSIDFDTLGVGFTSGGKDGDKNVHFGGTLSHADLYATAFASAVPEPGSAALLLAGMGGLALVARRRAHTG